MKTISIVRHAKSSWDEPGSPDILRTLNERGRATAKWMGEFLNSTIERPQLIISSPATRALHTTLFLAEGFDYDADKIRTESALYFGDAGSYEQILSELPDYIDRVMLVGHEPTVSRLSHTLAGEQLEKFPTCAVMHLQAAINKWEDIGAVKCTKRAFYIPRELME